MSLEDEKKKSLVYPSSDGVTLNWLFEHVPLKIWAGFIVILISVFIFGFGYGARLGVIEWFSDSSDYKGQIQDLTVANDGLNQKVQSINKKLQSKSKDLDSKLQALEELNNQTEINNMEFNKQLEKIKIVNKTISSNDEKLVTENKLLRVEIDSLKRKLMKVDKAKSEKAIKVSETNTSTNNNPNTAIINEGKITATQLISALPSMITTSVDSFLIEMIPKVEGGITCEEFDEMLGSVYITSIDDVIKAVAENVRNPIKNSCVKSISQKLYPPSAPEAINALLSAERK